MADVALIIEDTRETLTLTGVTGFVTTYPGKVTEHPHTERETVSDGSVKLARTHVMNAVIVKDQVRPDIPSGDARYVEVESFLESAHDGILLAIQRPSGSQLRDMVLESYTIAEDRTESLQISMQFRGARFVSTRGVQISARPDVAAALQDSDSTGTGGKIDVTDSNTSLANALFRGLRSLTGL